MTEKEYKEHLCNVILAVFRAEDAISKEWRPYLQQAIDENWPQDGRNELANEYVKALADEMIRAWLDNGHTMDELIQDIQ